MSTTTPGLRQTHLRTLRRLSLTATLLTFLLTHLADRLPLFDSSPHVLLASEDGFLGALAGPLLRWDAFHFLNIARNARFSIPSPSYSSSTESLTALLSYLRYEYQYEYEYAFMPGVPLVMKLVAQS